MNSIRKFVFKSIVCGITILGMFFLFSGYEGRNPHPPPFIGSMVEPFKEEGIHIRAKAYTAEESKTYLSRDLIQKGYQPVQITIQNNTGNTYLLSSHGIDLPNDSSRAVSFRVSSSAIPRAIGFKVAGFLFWPFLIPGTIDSILTFKSHLNMQNDLYAKSIKNKGEALPPYSTVHRVLFIPSEKYTEEFTLYLKERKSQRFYPFRVKSNERSSLG